MFGFEKGAKKEKKRPKEKIDAVPKHEEKVDRRKQIQESDRTV